MAPPGWRSAWAPKLRSRPSAWAVILRSRARQQNQAGPMQKGKEKPPLVQRGDSMAQSCRGDCEADCIREGVIYSTLPGLH